MSVAVHARRDRGETDIGLAVEGGLPLFDVPSRFGVQATHPPIVDNPAHPPHQEHIVTFSLIATFTALPGQRDEVARLIADFASAVRLEPGNLVFEPFTSAASDHDFVVYETYADEEAYQAHRRNPAGGPFTASLVERIVGDGSVLQFLTSVTG